MPYTFIPNLKVLIPRDASREAEAILVNERADHVNTPVAGKAEIWIKNDATQVLMVTDDAGVDRTVPDSTGTGSINATYYDERADHVNTPVAGKGEVWVKNDAPNRLIFTNDAGTDIVLGIQEVRIQGIQDVGLTQNAWYSWDTTGYYRDALWDAVAGGTGATPNLSATWRFPGIYFPREARLVSAHIVTRWNSATTGTVEWALTGTTIVDNQTAVGTVATHATASDTLTASGSFSVVTFTNSTVVIPAGSMLFLCHRRTSATAVTTDPNITFNLCYLETL